VAVLALDMRHHLITESLEVLVVVVVESAVVEAQETIQRLLPLPIQTLLKEATVVLALQVTGRLVVGAAREELAAQV